MYSPSEFKYHHCKISERNGGFRWSNDNLHGNSGRCECISCPFCPNYYNGSIRTFFSERIREHYEELNNAVFVGAFYRDKLARADKNIHTGEYFKNRVTGDARGTVVITATDAMQYSWEEDDTPKGIEKKVNRSIFTSALLDGLKTGEADRNKDGQISYEELYDYTLDRVSHVQTPQKWAFGVQGDIVIARNPISTIPPNDEQPQIIGYLFKEKWGSKGKADGRFINPTGIALDRSENVYVCDSGNERIQKFSKSGKFIAKWSVPRHSGDKQLLTPTSIAADYFGNVYVADSENHHIQKFNSTGVFITKWGSYGKADGQFRYPGRLVVDSFGNVYVADSGNHRIQKYNYDGRLITRWGSDGHEDGLFKIPNDIAVDSSGNVYVVDSRNHRIQVFFPLHEGAALPQTR